MSALWAVVCVALPFVVMLPVRLSTIDLAYHVRLGRQMLATHALPRLDVFTFTAAGTRWVDQQWGAQLILGLLHRASGWDGLVLLRTVLVGLTFLFVLLSCRAAGASARAAAFLTAASFFVALRGLALRPQLFAFGLFALCLWAVADRHRSPRRIWLVPVATLVWANLHGSFFFGPLLLALAAVEDRHRPDRRRALTWAIPVSVAATIVNPFGLGVWWYVGAISTNASITKMVTEWAPPTVRDQVGAAFFVSVALVAAFLAKRGHATPWPTLLAFGVFLALGLMTERGAFWWALAAPSLVASQLSSEARRSESRAPRVLVLGVVAAFAAMTVALLPWRTHAPGAAVEVTDAPIGVTAVLSSLPAGIRIFNAQPLGSWLEYALPADPVFVDSRIEVFSPAVWRDYLDVSLGKQGWQNVLDRWRVDVVVATSSDQRSLIERLAIDPGWRLAHRDHDASVYVRT